MKKFREPIKSAILIILICLMVYQTGRLWLFTSETAVFAPPFSSRTTSFLKAIGILSDTPAVLAETTDQGKAVSFMPLSVSFKKGQDVKTAAASQKAVENAMDIVGDILKKALSNSSEFKQRTKEDALFSEALSGDGILFDMGVPVSTGILTSLLNVQSRFEGANDLFIEYVFITPDKRKVLVYLYDSLHDEVCILNSGIEAKTLESLLGKAMQTPEFASATLSGDMRAAFENNVRMELSPFITIVTNPVTSNVLMSQNPIYSKEQREFNAESLHSVLSAFFYNPYSTRSYTESDGSLVYVENDSTLKFTQDGLAVYRAYSPQKGIPLEKLSPSQIPSVSAMVEASYALISRFDKSVCGGNAGLPRFKRIEYVQQESCYRVYMDYVCNGIPVEFSQNKNALPCMAVLDFSPDGTLASAQVYFRHYSFGDYVVNNVNQVTAIKILAIQNDIIKRIYGMNLEYIDDLKGTVYSEWVARVKAEG